MILATVVCLIQRKTVAKIIFLSILENQFLYYIIIVTVFPPGVRNTRTHGIVFPFEFNGNCRYDHISLLVIEN